GGWTGDVAFHAGGREITHAEVYEGAARTAGLLARLGVVPGDRVLLALPDGIELVWAFLGAVRLGAVAVPVNPRLTVDDHAHAAHPVAEDVAALVARHRVTVLFSVPTFYARLVAAGERTAWSSVRVAVSAGEALTPALAARSRALLGCPVLDGLGSTEVGQTFASNTLAVQRDGTVGRALPPYRL